MICPYCETIIDSENSELCENCGQALQGPKALVYGQPVNAIHDTLQKINCGEMSVERAGGLFGTLMSSVQGVLDQASEDLTENLKGLALHAQEHGEHHQDIDFIDDFGGVQESLHEALQHIGKLFGESKNLESFQANLPLLEQYLGSIQDSVDQLGLIKIESSTPGMTEYLGEPLPEQVSIAMDHYELAINALVKFSDESRNRADIQTCLQASEAASACLRKFLDGE